MSTFVPGATQGAALPEDVAVTSGSPGVQGSAMDPAEPKRKWSGKAAAGAAADAFASAAVPPSATRESTSAYNHTRQPLNERISEVARQQWKQYEDSDLR